MIDWSASISPGVGRKTVASPHAERYVTVIHDNDTNTIEEVIAILVFATGCSVEEAVIESWEADQFGKANVHYADEAECRGVAAIVSTIGVVTDVRKEWDD